MLGGWQGTFCAGISTHNIEQGVRGVDYVVNVRSFAICTRSAICTQSAFAICTQSKCTQSVLSLIVRNVILSQIKILVIEARITCIL
jgi:hypothetical protein